MEIAYVFFTLIKTPMYREPRRAHFSRQQPPPNHVSPIPYLSLLKFRNFYICSPCAHYLYLGLSLGFDQYNKKGSNLIMKSRGLMVMISRSQTYVNNSPRRF